MCFLIALKKSINDNCHSQSYPSVVFVLIFKTKKGNKLQNLDHQFKDKYILEPPYPS